MQKGNNKTNQKASRSHFLIADLVESATVLPGVNTGVVVRLVPPRETVSDPAHLEAFFVTLASLLARSAGSGQLAGGYVNTATSAKRHEKQKKVRQNFLSALQEREVTSKDGTVKAESVETRIRLKGLAKQYRPEWQHVVSFEIAGRYQEVSFLLRVADPALLSPVVSLLRQEYPYLVIETLECDPQKAGTVNRFLTTALTTSPTHSKQTKPGNTYRPDLLPNLGSFDPLLVADDTLHQLCNYRWLMLCEHSTLPLNLPGRANGNREADPKSTPLRRLLMTLANLQPGEIACSQLLVFGPVAKEWVKYHQAQAIRVQQRPLASQGNRVTSARNSQERSIAPSSRPTSSTSPADGRGLLAITTVAALACVGILWWQEFKELRQSGDTAQIAIWFSIRVGLLIIGLAALVLGWWVVRAGRSRAGGFPLQSLQDKLSSPPLLAALRQVVSINHEVYLYRVCNDPIFKPQFQKHGYNQGQAARLHKLRQVWFQLEADNSNATPNAAAFATSLDQKLAEEDSQQNEELWEFVHDITYALAEERVDGLQEEMAAAYSPFGSASGNAFVTVPGENQPGQCYSTLLPFDWPSPQRLRGGGLASVWPFNTRLIDRLSDFFDRELPPAAKEHRGLQVLNALEMSYLWHLPGGYETLDFVARTGPKTLSPSANLLRDSEKNSKRASSERSEYNSTSPSPFYNPLFGLWAGDMNEEAD